MSKLVAEGPAEEIARIAIDVLRDRMRLSG